MVIVPSFVGLLSENHIRSRLQNYFAEGRQLIYSRPFQAISSVLKGGKIYKASPVRVKLSLDEPTTNMLGKGGRQSLVIHPNE